MNVITKERLKDVCKSGEGEATCRYIVRSGPEWHCGKTSGFHKSMINGAAPGMFAKGDNCEGAPA